MKIVPMRMKPELWFYHNARSNVYNFYLGPLRPNVDVKTRRCRAAKLIRGVRRGWVPKLGLLRARKYGRAFAQERRDKLDAVLERLFDERNPK